jgi:hypothetical protein
MFGARQPQSENAIAAFGWTPFDSRSGRSAGAIPICRGLVAWSEHRQWKLRLGAATQIEDPAAQFLSLFSR